MSKNICIFIIIFIFICPGTLKAGEIGTEINIFLENNIFSVRDGIDYFIDNSIEQEYLQDIIPNNWNLVYNNELCSQISNNIQAGYIREYEGEILAKEDTVLFLIDRINDKYDKYNYSIDYYSFSQSLEGIILEKDIKYSNDICFTINSKLLRGISLSVSEYNGEVEVGEEVLFDGHKQSIQSHLGQETEMYDVDLSSYGFSIGGGVQWFIGSDYWLNFQVEDIINCVFWNDVYTTDINYNDTMLSILSNKKGDEYRAQGGTGKASYREYTTYLTPEYNLSLSNNRLNIGLYYYKKAYPFFSYKILTDKPELKIGLFADYYSVKIKYGCLKALLRTRDLNLMESQGITATLGVNLQF